MIHLIVGNVGAGKTTYSKRLSAIEKAFIFSLDEWNNKLYLMDLPFTDTLEWILTRIERCERMMMSQVLQLESLGINCVLDIGFAKYEQRERFREFAKENEIRYKLHYLDIATEERFKRVQKRNTEKGDTYEFMVSQDDFDFMEGWFETLRDDELFEAEIFS